jgi:hypothetical protein
VGVEPGPAVLGGGGGGANLVRGNPGGPSLSVSSAGGVQAAGPTEAGGAARLITPACS